MQITAPYRVKITVLATKVSGTQTGFPVYVDLSNMPSGFFTHVVSGADIRVTTSDGSTEVPYELVALNTGTQTGQLWFKGDISSSANTDFYIYYGSPGISAYAASDTYGSQNVWGSDAKLICHMQTDASDSSVTSANGTIVGTSVTTGMIGNGLSFNGISDEVNFPTSNIVSAASSIAMLSWIRTTTLTDHRFFARGYGSNASGRSGSLEINSGAFAMFLRDSLGATIRLQGTTPVTDTLFRVIGVWNQTTSSAYICVNGVAEDTEAFAGPSSSGTSNVLMMRDGSASAVYTAGIMDEAMIFSGAKAESITPAYALTEYNNQSSPSTFYSVSAEESFSGSGLPLITGRQGVDTPRLSATGFVPNLSVGATIKPKVWL